MCVLHACFGCLFPVMKMLCKSLENREKVLVILQALGRHIYALVSNSPTGGIRIKKGTNLHGSSAIYSIKSICAVLCGSLQSRTQRGCW